MKYLLFYDDNILPSKMAEVCASVACDFCGTNPCSCPCKECNDETLQKAYDAFCNAFLQLWSEGWFQPYYIHNKKARRVWFVPERTHEYFITAHIAISGNAPLSEDFLGMLLSICIEEMQLEDWPEFNGITGTLTKVESCLQDLLNEIAAKKRRESETGAAAGAAK